MKDLFGNEVDEILNAKERYGIWPYTVWPCDTNGDAREIKSIIGDNGNSRHDGWMSKNDSAFFPKHPSIFNPAIAAHILNLYAPEKGICFDPFAGGGTRAIMAAKHGLAYVGCEIRGEEVEAVNKRCESCGVSDAVQILHKDSRRSELPDGVADFSFTCPPYYNLEEYNGGPDDLSMMPTFTHFCVAVKSVLNESIRILKTGSLAVWVVGLLRGADGELVALNHVIGRLARAAGFYLKEEIILTHLNNGAVRRVGSFERGNNFLIRTHEYALVLEKRGPYRHAVD